MTNTLKNQKIGALWKRESKDGKIYFSGQIEDFTPADPTADRTDVVAFIRKKEDKVGKDGKLNPKLPDIEIFISRRATPVSNENGHADDPKATTPKPAKVSEPKAANVTPAEDEADIL